MWTRLDSGRRRAFPHLDMRCAFRRFKRRELEAGWQFLVRKAEKAPRSEVVHVRSSSPSISGRRVSEGLISCLESQAVPAQAGSDPASRGLSQVKIYKSVCNFAQQFVSSSVVSDLSSDGGETCSSSQRAVPMSPMCPAAPPVSLTVP